MSSHFFGGRSSVRAFAAVICAAMCSLALVAGSASAAPPPPVPVPPVVAVNTNIAASVNLVPVLFGAQVTVNGALAVATAGVAGVTFAGQQVLVRVGGVVIGTVAVTAAGTFHFVGFVNAVVAANLRHAGAIVAFGGARVRGTFHNTLANISLNATLSLAAFL
jgi:hypothetical protein